MEQSFTLSFLKLRLIGLILAVIVPIPVLKAQNFIFSKTVDGNEVIYSANWNFTSIRQLTGPEANCTDPHVSPDGKHIAFFKGIKGSDIGLWIMDINGENAARLTYDPLGDGCHPSWHPDGNYILYELDSKTDKSESYIRIVRKDGKGARNIFNNAKDLDKFPCMNPADSGKIVYHYDQGTWPYFSQIRLRDLFSGKDDILLDNNGWADGYFSFSPDGRMLLWSEEENGDEMRLRTLNLETRSINTICTVKGPYRSISGAFEQTGKYIFYTRRSFVSSTEVVRCFADGSSPVILYTADNINSLCMVPGIPVARYEFYGNTIDASGYGIDASPNNVEISYNRCFMTGNAFHFNGLDNYISVPHNDIFNLGTGDLSVLAIVSAPGVLYEKAVVVSSLGTASTNDNGFLLGIDATGKPFFELSSGDGTVERVDGSRNICDNNYHVICGVRENGTIKIFVDSVFQGNTQSTISLFNNNPLDIGGNSSGYNNGVGFLYGNIDDILVYPIAISERDIASLLYSCYPTTGDYLSPCNDCDLTVEWLAPAEQPTCGVSKPSVKIRIKNNGTGSADEFRVGYSLDGGSTYLKEDIEVNLLPGDSIDYTFSQPADMSAVRTYSCSAVVRKFGDTIRNNDTIYAQVINKRREISVETAETKCTEATGGAIITGITNGVAPYSYSWSSGSVKDRADTLEAGFYKVTVTDSEGCTASQSFTIEETGAPKLTSNTIIKNNSCFGNPDGSIDITVIGGSIPYKYQWSNGMLTEDITLLPPGQYDVVITDNTSCRRFASFIVQEPPPLYLSVASVNSSANANNGIADVNVTGGTQPYKYLWPLTGETTSNISDLVPGIYSVIVTDKNGCTDSISATIFKLCGPDIIVNSVTPSECGLRNGSIDISIPGDNGPYEYLWSNGDTVQDLTCVPSGEYTMTVAFKDSACASVADITIPAVLDPVPICMVTVDTATEHNMIIWQEPYYAESLSAFNIYRETEGYEVFELIGTRLINEESFYIDTDRVANTAVKSWKYKLSVVDTCGNESELYGFHKTMHLEVNEGPGNTMILTWDNYSGFDYFTCHIYRYSPEEGLVKIFSKASTPELIFNTYTDLTPPDSGYNYFIEIESPYSCTSQKKATSHNSVRSNKAKQVSSTGIKSPGLPENLLNMGLYPNPNNGTFILILNFQNPEVLLIRIYDSNGRLVTERKTAVQLSRHEENFNLDGSGPGVYFIQVITNEGVVNKPFIIE